MVYRAPYCRNRGLCAAGQWFLLTEVAQRKKRSCTWTSCSSQFFFFLFFKISVQTVSGITMILEIGNWNPRGRNCAHQGGGRFYLLTSVAVTVMLCHMSVSRSRGLASVIFPSSTLMLNCLSRSVCRSMKYLQRDNRLSENLSHKSSSAAALKCL